MYQYEATILPLKLLKKYDRPGPRYTSYPTAPVWSEEISSEDYRKSLQIAGENADQPLSLYCHIPYCQKRCYFCACNTVIARDVSSADDYLKLMLDETKKVSDLLCDRKKIGQLHLGGGTPTFLDPEGLDLLLSTVEKKFDILPNAELSVEIDPRVTSAEQLELLAKHNFNRASLGVQDFDSDVQIAAGRPQPKEDVARILDDCRRFNYKGINFDLIYGLPKQTVDSFGETLDEVIAMRPDRLAVYSFAYLPEMKAHQTKIKPEELPETHIKYRLFAMAVEKLTGAGYLQIGMDHFSLPSDELTEAQSDGRLHRNFMGYTVQSSPDMIGVGMSSIGYIDNTFFQNWSKLGSYKQAVGKDKLAVYRGMRLSRDDLIRKFLITSLMCNFQLKFDNLKEKFGIEYMDYFADEHIRLDVFVKDGLINLLPGGLKVTAVGRTFIRNIAMTFDAYLNKKRGEKRPTYSRTI